MRNYEQELENRVAFIRQLLKESGCEGIVYGNSGGKDSALVGILCKKACGNTVGILLPCATTQNYGSDTDDAIRVAEQYGIAYRTVDLSETRGALIAALEKAGVELNNAAVSNIAPRLRMTALYAVAAAEHRLVAGTGNRSEAFMGYCTKWGDAAADFNPIADLSVTEVFEGSLRRAFRRPDGREGNGRLLRRHRPLYGRRRRDRRRARDHRALPPQQRAQACRTKGLPRQLNPCLCVLTGSVSACRLRKPSQGGDFVWWKIFFVLFGVLHPFRSSYSALPE